MGGPWAFLAPLAWLHAEGEGVAQGSGFSGLKKHVIVIQYYVLGIWPALQLDWEMLVQAVWICEACMTVAARREGMLMDNRPGLVGSVRRMTAIPALPLKSWPHLSRKSQSQSRSCVRLQLIERASSWTAGLGLQGSVCFMTANATVSLGSMLSSYPGPLTLVTVQVMPLAVTSSGRRAQVRLWRCCLAVLALSGGLRIRQHLRILSFLTRGVVP